jgi:hypothetical protein
MKYINLRISPNNNNVEVTRACSHGDCDQILKGDENYCPKCGSPLKKLPDHLDKEAIIALVNENIDKLPKPPTAESKANLDDHCSTTGGIDGHDGWTVTNKGKETTECPYGKGTPEICGFCTSKGACTIGVLTSMPPQYDMCPFRGSGFIRCSEAD